MLLPSAGEICHDFPMTKFKTLRDLYRFPGFTPRASVRGLFGDPMAVVISLHRRGKKLLAVFAVARTTVITTNGLGMSAISRVATSASFCSFLCAECNAPGVAV
jgi:hypothetical protein